MSFLTIGIYSDAADLFVQGVVAGVVQYCTEKGGFRVRDFRMRKMLENLNLDPQPWKGLVDGVVVMMGLDQYSGKETADWIVGGGTPAVHYGHDWYDPRVPSFHADHVQIAVAAADHLRDCGCESYIFLGFAKSSGSADRGNAFVKAAGQTGKPAVYHPMPVQMIGGFEDSELIRKDAGLVRLLGDLPRPIGLFALNDFFAAGACALCRELGMRVPEDVRILGSGDTACSRLNDPPLSTLRTPREQMGYETMKGLHRLLQGQKLPERPTQIGGTCVVSRVSTVSAPQTVGNIDDVRRYIEDHACAGVTVDQLVQIVGISRRSFETWFREQVGRSPRDEINRVRLEKARQLLTRSELSMARIATMVGFQESAAFSRFFRNETGVSPREFRQTAAVQNKQENRSEGSRAGDQNLEFQI
jgi:LacI family transcriptional regulator